MFTRSAPVYSSDRRRPLTIVLLLAAAVYLLLTAAGTLWTDFLWFDSLGYGSVWAKNWGTSLALGAFGLTLSFLIFWSTLIIAQRLSPRWVPMDLMDEELAERFREWVEPRLEKVRLIVAALLALFLGLATATWRDEAFLFLNARPFGTTDPIFGVDLSFYVFRLPLLRVGLDWLFSLLVMAFVLAAIAFYLNGGLRIERRSLVSTRGAKIQLSVMLAVMALVRAGTYFLDRYELLFSDRTEPKFHGAGFADINSRLPAIRLLIAVAVIAAILFIINIWRRGWTLVLVVAAAWFLVSVLGGAVYPALVQRFSVLPNQLAKEMPYITHNLTATREAYGLDGIEVRNFRASPSLTMDDIEANRLTIDNIRIWSAAVLPRTYQNFQELEPYYSLAKVSTDRYIDDNGQPRQVMLAVRELEEVDLPRDDWQNTRLFYTHGFGAVVNQANVVQADGQPQFLLKDVPPVASPGYESLELEQPRVYFGRTYQPGRPVIVRTGAREQEIDIPLPEGTRYNQYDGDAGVVIDNIFKRIAFAFRYRDLNLLISGELRNDSRVLVERNIKEIADQVAPFLYSDAEPYPVILDGRIMWVVDMYTATSFYPYSEPVSSREYSRLAVSSRIPFGVNYIRNSVKAVIDAYDGTLTYYVMDDDDPIIRAWSSNYPGLFKPFESMPEGLVEHLRYPQDLFRIQSSIYLEYHVTETTELFQGNDAWSLPADPATIVRSGDELLRGDSPPEGYLREVLPYYLLTKLPGEEDLSYLLLQPFNPRERRNMVSFLVADSTPGRYGRLIDFRMPQGTLVDGVGQVGQRIEQDADIAEQLSLWDNSGSTVLKGDLLVVPIEDSVVYFQPFYLEERGGAFPEFRRVAVVFGERVEWASSLNAALRLVFDNDQPQQPTDPGDPIDGTIEELLERLGDAFAAADAALQRRDLGEYQRWIEMATRIYEEIERLVHEGTGA
ncbi:MAG TPA: UPF0182 family protein [Acidimicrobiia bacterium]|nr:UPF0182 family protein [Acidimicrobiia bacterium]